jgi:hypothetical protein
MIARALSPMLAIKRKEMLEAEKEMEEEIICNRR